MTTLMMMSLVKLTKNTNQDMGMNYKKYKNKLSLMLT